MAKAKPFPVFASILTLCGVVILCSLGTWQLQRLAWKEDLLARIDAQAAAPSKDFTVTDLVVTNEFQSGTIQGRFIGPDIRIIPRTYNGQPGAHILTPFETQGAVLLVNRGWVGLHETPAPANGSMITGMIRTPPRSNMFTPANDSVSESWYRIEMQEIGEAYNLPELAPVMLYQSCHEDAVTLNPCGLTLNIKNDHLQYATFWFSMAGVLIVMFGLRFLRKEEA